MNTDRSQNDTILLPIPGISDEPPRQETIRYLSQTQLASISALGLTVASISFLCTCITILTYAFWRRFRKSTSHRIVMFIAVCDMISALCMILAALTHGLFVQALNPFSCLAQAVMLQWADLSAAFWTLALSANLVLVLCSRKSTGFDVEQYEKFYFFGCFGLAFVFAFLPLVLPVNSAAVPWPGSDVALGLYGDREFRCWIEDDISPIWEWIFYLIPIMVVLCVNLMAYTVTSYFVLSKTTKLQQTVSGRNSALTARNLNSGGDDVIAYIPQSSRNPRSGTRDSFDLTNIPMSVFRGQALSSASSDHPTYSSTTNKYRSWSGFSGFSDDTSRPHAASTASSVSNTPSIYAPTMSLRKRYFFRIAVFTLAYLLGFILPSLYIIRAQHVNRQQGTTRYLYRAEDYYWYLIGAVVMSWRGIIDFLCYFFVAVWNTNTLKRASQQTHMGGSASSKRTSVSFA